MNGSGGHHLPLEWLHPGPYDYDPYTNSFVPLPPPPPPPPPPPDYGYGFGVGYSWNPPDQHQGHMQSYLSPSSSSYSLLSILGPPPPLALAAVQRRSRGRGRGSSRGRGRRRLSQPRQHGGPGLLGADPSSLQRPPQLPLPPPRRSIAPPDEPSSSSVQVQPPPPVPALPPPSPPPPPASSSPSPSSHAMTPPPVPDSHGCTDDVSMTAAAKMDASSQSQDDVVVVGLSGSSSTATATDKKRLLPLDPPAAQPVKNSDAVDVSMAHRDDQGDVLGLNLYMAKKRLLSTKASSLAAADTYDAKEEAKAAAARNKKTCRIGWGQGLAKFENRYNKKDDDETTQKLVAHDGATGEPVAASSHGSSPPQGSKGGHGDNDSLDDMPEMRVSHVNTVPDAFFSKGSSRPLTGDLGDLWKNRSITSFTESSPADEVPAGSSGKHSPSAADESSMNFTKDDNIPPRMEKVIVKMVRPIRMIKNMNVLSEEEPETNENDAAPLVPGIATVTATENYKRINAEAEAVKKPVNKICHDSTANLPDKGHGELSKDGNEHVTGKVLVGESNSAPSPLGMRSSQVAMSETVENFNEDNSSNEAVCITKSSSKVKENVPQSVLIANHGDEGNCVAGGGSYGLEDTFKITFFPDEISAKLANDTIKWTATDNKLVAMKNPNSKDHRSNTSDPAAMLTGPALVRHMLEHDEAMEKLEESKKHGSGSQLSCEVNSEKEMETVDSIPIPEGNDLNPEMENPTKDSGPCIATNSSVVRDDGLIQHLRASEAMFRNSGNNDAKVKSKDKGKGIMPSPEVDDLNEPPMQISNEAPKTYYHLPSSSGYAALVVDAKSAYVAMDIDLNIPLDVTPVADVSIVDLGNSSSSDSEATDSDETMEIISPSQTTPTAAVTQTAQQQPAIQPAGSMMLFGEVIYQASSTGTTNHTLPNHRNLTAVIPSSNSVFTPVVPATSRQRGRGQVYPSTWATSSSVWRGGVPPNQLGQQAVLSNRMLYGGSTDGASSSSASLLQPGTGSRALANMVNQQQRQQALANIMRGGGLPAAPAAPHQMPGSSSGVGAVNYRAGFNPVPQQWGYPVINTSIRLVVGVGLPTFYYPGAIANQAPAAAANTMQNNGQGASTSNIRAPANTMLSVGTNNGEGASTGNTRAPPAAGRGRGRGRGSGRGRGGPNPWLSLRPNNQE